MAQTKAEKALDKRVAAAFNATCGGIQLNIMDFDKVFAVGRAAILDGADEATLGATVRAYVETIRHN